LRAMALRPEDRYASARDLAADVEHWLADEPVGAYPEPASVRLRRWAKHHRVVVSSLAVLLLTATGALTVGLLAVNAEKNRTKKANRETEDALARLRVSLDAEKAAREAAQASEKSAREQRTLALETLRGVVHNIQAQLRDRPAQQELRKLLLTRALAGLQEVARAADTGTRIDHEAVWVHTELGDLLMQLEEGGVAEAEKQYKLALNLARRGAEA